jgi:hypothetical protein
VFLDQFAMLRACQIPLKVGFAVRPACALCLGLAQAVTGSKSSASQAYVKNIWRENHSILKDLNGHNVHAVASVLARARPAERSTTMPLIEVHLVEEVFNPEQKRQIIQKLTDAMVSVEGENMRDVTWVIPKWRAASGASAENR